MIMLNLHLGKMGMAELNLSSLPLDIIRLIIRANVGERTENMRMVSKIVFVSFEGCMTTPHFSDFQDLECSD